MPSKNRKRGKRQKKTIKSIYIFLIVPFLVAISSAASLYMYAFRPIQVDSAWIYIPTGASEEDVRDSLVHSLGERDGMRVYRLWDLQGGKANRSHGAYRVSTGDKAFRVARRLLGRMQTPVTVKWTDVRTMSQLSERVTKNIECGSGEFLAACEDVLPGYGYNSVNEYPAAFLPDSYEVYWDISAADLVDKLASHTNQIWTAERLAKAQKIGLTPTEVATLASIVEEETAKWDERGKVARLYLNRLDIGMKLQADPTVKFAVGDFSIKRIKGEMLKNQSRFNTYVYQGLPPGPIRIVDLRTIDSILDAPKHDYIYMCAKEDFSGYHNFAKDYATHQANARRYQAELNKRNL